ncbi:MULTISPECIES: flagellar export chaperone FlgN [unclassified Burkholderia]|uniref:flagellar export chaperone FlgN n=1 Tax=unclassified Burkholderia TaxID=2613784 RepID=UPI000757545A|nr:MULTISPECIES: flagellar export chaperone FlgN [unclassified Burkholderia]KUY54604.1 flagellar biosynthesis protein FliR [Burkholderia sp. RF2-non_BP3]KUY72489.1 flagellar biosynthesis protein FliR [Burkholderia sp. RF4-BP95]
MTRNEAFAKILDGIRVDVARYAEMKGLLDLQFAAALRRDGASLMATGNAILALADALRASHEMRRRCMHVLVSPLEPESMTQAWAALPGRVRERLTRVVAQFESQIQECRNLNQRNAALLMSQFEIAQRALYGEVDTYVGR